MISITGLSDETFSVLGRLRKAELWRKTGRLSIFMGFNEEIHVNLPIQISLNLSNFTFYFFSFAKIKIA